MKTLENATPVSVPEKPDSSNHSKTSNGLPVIPDGWALVPVEPTPVMMDAGLYQSSHDSEWADVFSAWKDMVAAAPDAQDAPLRTEADVRAEARREALEEVGKCIASLRKGRGDLRDDDATRYFNGGLSSAFSEIRALIDRP